MSDGFQPCQFTFDGVSVNANSGQTIAGALHGAGKFILSRSFKYHRPRGLFCVSGRCPNCLCTVDGEPNVRICTRIATPDIQVESQNAWPSIRFDVLAIFDKLHRFMPVGFYYKIMHRPRFLWPMFEKFIRRVAGLGQVDTLHGCDGVYDKLNLFTNVAVIGAGWAGLYAALEAANAGVSVTLVDEQLELGGHLRHDPDLESKSQISTSRVGLIETVRAHPNINVIDSAVAIGCYEENYLAIQRGNRLIRLRADQMIVATGGWERPLIFENNDLPGNFLASGVQRLLHLDGCRFDGSALIVTDNAQGYRVANQLSAAGMKVAAIVDAHEQPSADSDGIDVITGSTVIAARGRRHVKAAVVQSIGGTSQQTISCRWIIQAVGFIPATSLVYQSGCRLEYDPELDQPLVTKYAAGTHSAGAVNGTHDLRVCAFEGQRAGLAAVAAIKLSDSDIRARLAELNSEVERGRTQCFERFSSQYVTQSTAKKKFVCLCEDVTEKDLCDAIDEGYSNIETLKRYSTVCMGPCQGKMCQASSIAICARHNGRPIEQTGTTTARPPEQPVLLGVLAGRAPHFSVTRRTAIHHWHAAAGASFMNAGTWKRPERYMDSVQEYKAVRQQVGLIDVSTLGKIEMRGNDVAEFLEFIYPNRFAKLKVGRVRYGVLCDEAGIILDDGTITRLEDDRFYLTTTSGNAEAIDSWFRWWLASGPHRDVRMTNVTSCYAAMNIAGPRSRDCMLKLCESDLATETMPYLAAAQFKVAGVPAIVLRIGFVGELGYEIHVATQFGLHVWQSLMSAGDEFGIQPFGIEAQRMLRLDKKHILAGVDTDALSNPLEADMPWIVKLDKTDFIGRSSLVRSQNRGLRNRLVGFRIDGDEVPDESSIVIYNRKIAGRITSSRFSPAADATIGLAWVPVEKATNGEIIEIRLNGRTFKAVVQLEPFYDPGAERLKS